MPLNFSAMFQGLAQGTETLGKAEVSKEEQAARDAADEKRQLANQAFQDNLRRFEVKSNAELQNQLEDKRIGEQQARDVITDKHWTAESADRAAALASQERHQTAVLGQESARTKLAQTEAEDRKTQREAEATKATAQATKAEADVKAGEAKTVKEQALAGTSALDSQEKRYEESVRSARLTYENLSQNSTDKKVIADAAKDLQEANAKLKAVQAKNEKLREHYQTQLAPDYKEEKQPSLLDTAKDVGGKIGSALKGAFIPGGDGKAAAASDAAATPPAAAATPPPAAGSPMPGIGAPFLSDQAATAPAAVPPTPDEINAYAQRIATDKGIPLDRAKAIAAQAPASAVKTLLASKGPPAAATPPGVPAAPAVTQPVATPAAAAPAPAAAPPAAAPAGASALGPVTQAAPVADTAKLDAIAAQLPEQVTTTIAKLADLDPKSPQFEKNSRIAEIQIQKMFPGVDAQAVIDRVLEQNAQPPMMAA